MPSNDVPERRPPGGETEPTPQVDVSYGDSWGDRVMRQLRVQKLISVTAGVASAVSLAFSGLSFAKAEHAAHEAWTNDQCVTLVAQYDRLADMRAAALRALAEGSNLSAEEAGQLRAQLSQAEAELEVRTQVEDCLDEQEQVRREAALKLVKEALDLLRTAAARLPSKSPSPTPT
ncbi:hypothetical protein ABZW18_32065 [Streptomyces sp. NPDC004647]|uniref:hypothetical protein n=1 Tax=Streptomyces sp. NPDC004647 TaxID=3154671 RepID=UPI0033A659EF